MNDEAMDRLLSIALTVGIVALFLVIVEYAIVAIVTFGFIGFLVVVAVMVLFYLTKKHIADPIFKKGDD